MITVSQKLGVTSYLLALNTPESENGQIVSPILDGDTLYRRYQDDHFDADGDYIPAFFSFPDKRDNPKSGQSFLLGSLSCVLHALHRNCNDNRPLKPGVWGVLSMSVESVPKELEDFATHRMFYFRPVHKPYATCNAHCELFCTLTPNGLAYELPPRDVRTRFRIRIARSLKPTGVKAAIR